MLATPKTSLFESPRGQFNVMDFGGQGPLLHLGHATGFCAGLYSPLAERLTSRLQVVGMDDRGHGMSMAEADASQLHDWDVFYQDLRAFLEAQEEPAVLIAHSRGGIIAAMIAARWPHLVRALVLLDPTVLPYWWMWWWYLAKKTGASRLVPIAYRAARRRNGWPSRKAVFDSWHGRGPFAKWHDEFLEAYVEYGLCESESGGVELCCEPAWESRCFSTCEHRIWGPLKRIDQPTLIIYGEESDTFLPAAVKRIKRVMSRAEVIGMSGTGHFAPMEHPDECASLILDFLERHEVLS